LDFVIFRHRPPRESSYLLPLSSLCALLSRVREMAGRHEEDLVEVGEADTHTVADSGSSTTVSKPPVRAAVPPTTKPPRTGIMGLYDKVFDWCWNNRVGTRSRSPALSVTMLRSRP